MLRLKSFAIASRVNFRSFFICFFLLIFCEVAIALPPFSYLPADRLLPVFSCYAYCKGRAVSGKESGIALKYLNLRMGKDLFLMKRPDFNFLCGGVLMLKMKMRCQIAALVGKRPVFYNAGISQMTASEKDAEEKKEEVS